MNKYKYKSFTRILYENEAWRIINRRFIHGKNIYIIRKKRKFLFFTTGFKIKQVEEFELTEILKIK